MLTVGDKFPAFSLKAVRTSEIGDFPLVTDQSDKGKWKLFFFWPKDFTFICPTEIMGYGDLYTQFKERNCIVYGCSTDSDFVHVAWRKHHDGLKNSPFAWLSDIRKELSNALGILHKQEGVCLRATYLVDPEGVIRHVSINDLSVGRNVEETLRILDGLQSEGLCGCNWQKGQDYVKVA